ncbi:MAG: hypothetical protein ACRDKJ_09335 [Actinomycetota bacterium]
MARVIWTGSSASSPPSRSWPPTGVAGAFKGGFAISAFVRNKMGQT